MKLETAQIRLSNAVHRFQDPSEFGEKLRRILRGIWLDHGVDAVNAFVQDNALNIGFGDIPVVRSNFTDDEMQTFLD